MISNKSFNSFFRLNLLTSESGKNSWFVKRKRRLVCQSAKAQSPSNLPLFWELRKQTLTEMTWHVHNLSVYKRERKGRKLGQCAFPHRAQLPELLTFPAGPSRQRPGKESLGAHRPLWVGFCKADLANRAPRGQAVASLWEEWLPVSASVPSQSPMGVLHSQLHSNLC